MKKIFFAIIAVLTGVCCANAQFVVEMKDNTSVPVSGNVTFSTDNVGDWAVGATYTSKMSLENVASITIAPADNVASVGDFFYSDGTWSSTLDVNKKPIGIVFWVGNATEQDAALKNDHPECIHGLVVGLYQTRCEWQDNYSDMDMTVGEWIEENTDYATIESDYGLNQPVNKIMGYNNTMAIDEFNDSDLGWDYEVIVGSKVSSTMSKTPAPASTSGWYIPSAKEVSLIISGPYDGDIDDIGYEEPSLVANCALINSKLAEINGAVEISGVYWSSNEESERIVFTLQSKSGLLMESSKGGSNLLRPILAF